MFLIQDIPFIHPWTLLKGVAKYGLFCGLITIFLIHQGLASLILLSETKRLRYFMWSIQRTSLLGLKILNVEVSLDRRATSPAPTLLVSNHISYLDVLVLFAHYPALFITSVEMGSVPVLGWITKLAGCLFVERRKELRSAETIKKEKNEMNEKLNSGLNIFLFPEGTSSDGRGVLAFKSTFFQVAIDCQVPVSPIIISYGQGKYDVPWYGKMTFPDHLFRLCLREKLSARLVQLEPLLPSGTRTELKTLCHERIVSEYAKH